MAMPGSQEIKKVTHHGPPLTCPNSGGQKHAALLG